MKITLINIIGWVPLIIFWALKLSGNDMGPITLALPAFSIGTLASAIILSI